MLVRSAAVVNRLISRKSCLRLSSTEVSTKESSSVGKEGISVPYRIPRGSTDILKALASTVGKDHLAPHYKYEDDPYLIPVSNVSKRSYALSKEAGRKAARYFLENHPELFVVNKAEPAIKAFDPPVVYTEKDDVSEDTLNSCIESIDLTNSLTVYNLLKERGLPCSQSTKQRLLELLCFYNSEQPPRHDYTEEKWYRMVERPKNTWKNNGEAEKLFQEMEKDAEAYAAMIQGTAKYLNVEKAATLYEEMCTKGFKGTLDTYNSMLSIVTYLKQDGDMRWQCAMDLVKNMNEDGIGPNLWTMNALLSIASKSRRWNKGQTMTMQTLAEMKRLNIEPSLGTYYHVLNVFCLNSSNHNNALAQILAKIKGKEFTMQHPDDIMFFSSAMELCNKLFASKDLAYKLNDLLECGKNSVLLGNALNESIYFRHFFLLLAGTEDFDKFMEVYEKYTPNAYTPEPSVMLEIIRTLAFCGGYQHLPQICSDVHMFEQTEREDVLSELVKVAAEAKMEEKHHQMVINVFWDIVEKLDARMESRMIRRFSWSGQILGDILTVFLNGKDLEKAWYVMKKFKEREESIIGHPPSECLVKACVAFLEAKDFDKLRFCVKYAYESCHSPIKDDLLKQTEGVEAKLRSQLDSILQEIVPQEDWESKEEAEEHQESKEKEAEKL